MSAYDPKRTFPSSALFYKQIDQCFDITPCVVKEMHCIGETAAAVASFEAHSVVPDGDSDSI
jgi:hypothetical protein